jgi:hypothetical protein
MVSQVKVINTDIVFRSLSVPQNERTKLRKEGHPLNHTTKFKFKKRNNIIIARFLSGGITEQTYKNEIESYKYYLEKTLNTSVEEETFDGAKTLKVKRKPGSGYILINFYYVVTKVPGKEDNEGIKYELDIIEKLKTAGYTQQSKPEGGIDVTINIKGVSANIELKEKIEAAFGSGTLEFRNNSWHISPKSNPVIKKLFNDELVDWVNEMWYENTNGYVPSTRATKEDQQVLGGGTGYYKDIPSHYITDYYEKSDYIQIKGKGFYKINRKNPLNIPTTQVSNFNSTSAKARIRVKKVKSGDQNKEATENINQFVYKVELYIGDVDRSVNHQGLDGDLSFLSN